MQEGHYVQEKEFSGIGITPFDPYHNSSFVVAGESKRRNGGGGRKLLSPFFFSKPKPSGGEREKTLFSPAEDKSRRKTSLFLRRDFAGSPGNPALPRSVSVFFSQEVKLEDKCCEGKDILVKQSQDTLLSAEAVCNTWYLPTFVRKREAS